MYKFIDRTGKEIGERYESLKEALDQIRKLRRSGLKVVVVDSSTNIVPNRSSNRKQSQ